MQEQRRKGYMRGADIPADFLKKLSLGEQETVTIAELFALDLGTLLAANFPKIPEKEAAFLRDRTNSFTSRFKRGAELLQQHYGQTIFEEIEQHRSDVIRAWGAELIALNRTLTLPEKLTRLYNLANDSHSGVREMVWMSLRPEIVEHMPIALTFFKEWVTSPSENIRRFAVEATRPRGVCCKHSQLLKEDPAHGLVLLQPLHADPSRYVQNAVANWLNDASKTQPEWVEALCAQWLHQSDTKATQYICKRALRTLRKKA